MHCCEKSVHEWCRTAAKGPRTHGGSREGGTRTIVESMLCRSWHDHKHYMKACRWLSELLVWEKLKPKKTKNERKNEGKKGNDMEIVHQQKKVESAT